MGSWRSSLFAMAMLATVAFAPSAFAVDGNSPLALDLPLQVAPSRQAEATELMDASCADAQSHEQNPPQQVANPSGAQAIEAKKDAQQQGTPPAKQCGSRTNKPGTTQPGQQPKRILGVMPNFRAVSAGALPPPPTPKQSFKIATQNSFDYSSFIFVGITSMLAEGTDAHPDLGKGVAGFGRYYWRGFLDKTDGNYLVIFALPTVFHQDERYYAKGKGNFWKRGIYAASRILITPDYHGHDSFNASELLGRAMAQGVSISYYPKGDRTIGALASKYAYALGRDALTNTFREYWPDIAQHVLHRHP
ncbi:MAG TPA: hypothetical protein VLY23_11825 [Candidatus Acidoferrum sp.]|nr:hypothetical protein [Candidatus Acidoferrum sp.]